MLVRKKAFCQWLRDADRRAGSDQEPLYTGDYGVYMVDGLHTPAAVTDFVESHYRQLFENELREWHEPDLWPKNRDYDTFCQFFEVQVHRQVYQAG